MDIKVRINNYNVTIRKLINKRDDSPPEMYNHYQAQIDKKAIKINMLIWVLDEK